MDCTKLGDTEADRRLLRHCTCNNSMDPRFGIDTLPQPTLHQTAAHDIFRIQTRKRRHADTSAQSERCRDSKSGRHLDLSTPSACDLHQPSVASPYATIAAGIASSRRPID